jgi:hypothetical protein
LVTTYNYQKEIKDNLDGQNIMQLRHQSIPMNVMHNQTQHCNTSGYGCPNYLH